MTRPRPGAAAIAASIALLLLACAQEPTRIVLVTGTDLAVPGELDRIVYEIDATAAGSGTTTRDADLRDGSLELPIVVGLLHAGGPLGPISIRARGTLDGAMVVERSARVSFVAGRSVVLRLDLVAACRDLDCPSGTTCAGQGRCESDAIDASQLPPYEGPGTIAPLGDAGPIAIEDDAGADDAGIDLDASLPPPDSSMPRDARVDARAPTDARVSGDTGIDAPMCMAGCDCEQECAGGGCRCESGCGCAMTCTPGDDCRGMVCDGATTRCVVDAHDVSNLEITCDHEATCIVDASGASNALELECKHDATCEVDCSGASNCELTCKDTSTCLLECAGASSCALRCEGGTAIDCGGGTRACRRACPP